MDCERAFQKSFVVGFDAPPSRPVPTTHTATASRHGSSSPSTTARSLLTMLLKESASSSDSSATTLADAVDSDDCCDSQSEGSSSWGDDADAVAEEDELADDGFVVSTTEPIPIVTSEPMKVLASYWVSIRPLANKRLQAEPMRK